MATFGATFGTLTGTVYDLASLRASIATIILA